MLYNFRCLEIQLQKNECTTSQCSHGNSSDEDEESVQDVKLTLVTVSGEMKRPSVSEKDEQGRQDSSFGAHLSCFHRRWCRDCYPLIPCPVKVEPITDETPETTCTCTHR